MVSAHRDTSLDPQRAFDCGEQDGYAVAAWENSVEQGLTDPRAEGAPSYDQGQFLDPDSGAQYRAGLSYGRTRFVDELQVRRKASENGQAGEPSPVYDPGPYEDQAQAAQQIAASLLGIPIGNEQALRHWVAGQVREALTLAGVQTTDYEESEIDLLPISAGPEGTQVVAGFIRRAFLAGLQHRQPSVPDERTVTGED